MNFAEMTRIDAQAREHFTYEVQPFNLTHWRSHRDAVLAGQPWRGPCADLTSTVLDMATRCEDPASLTDCFRLLVSIDRRNEPDHMVGCIKTTDHGFIIFGDTTRRGAYAVINMRHQWHSYGCMAEAGPGPGDVVWRKGVPW